MYSAFAKEYPSPALDLNTDIEVFPVSSATPDQGTIVYAIWDTGASQTVITHRLMTKLNLVPIETELVHGINSKQTVEVRWKGIASFGQRIYFFLSYTERDNRTRIISARLAEPLERERYDENYQKQIAGYE